MCLTLRKTASRGRWVLPATFRRIRLWTRLRMIAFDSWAMLFGASRRTGFAGLLAQSFIGVADSFVLVGIRRTQGAHVGRHLAQQLPVAAGQNQRRKVVHRLVDLHIDAIGEIELDGMRVSQGKRRDAPLDVALVSDAENLQLPR